MLARLTCKRYTLRSRLWRKTSRRPGVRAGSTKTAMHHDFTACAARLREFIRRNSPDVGSCDRLSSAESEMEFAALATELFRLQFAANEPFRALCRTRGVTPATLTDWRDIPAVPTEAFKEAELTCLVPTERTAVFHSSGTTQQRPSRHFHSAESLALYEASLRPWFRQNLLGELDEKPCFLALTPAPAAAPHSSLAHMLGLVLREFAADDSLFAGTLEADGTWSLDLDRLLFALQKSSDSKRPLVLLGTAFNFVHLLDYFAINHLSHRLAAGSRVMETGGYKGRARELPKAELHALITKHLGVPRERIVSEYGMSELSSQAYEVPDGKRQTSMSDTSSVTLGASHVTFHFPPWARARVISPETGGEVAEGETGLLRIVDLANAWSVLAVQTGDLAIRRGTGFALLGRAATVEPRGCSLLAA